jgi:imidazolonepropionase-like amidohydrolase
MPGEASFRLAGGMVWDGVADRAAPGDVTVAAGAIVEPGTAADAITIDVSGCTVLPGLIEGHGHLCFNAQADWRAVYDSDSPASMLLRMAGAAQRMLRAGITTVRDLGAPTALAIELRDAIRAGTVTGPALVVSGAPITTTGGHCYFMGGEADGVDGIRKAVRERARAGVDWIKVMATGGNMTPRTNTFAPQYTVQELHACIEDAHRLGLRVTAHAHGIEGIRVAVEAHVDMIEHCSFTTPAGIERDDALIGAIAEREIIVSPTVSVGYGRWADDGRKAARADVTRAMLDAGCRVLMSTDCGIPNVPHDALADGLDVLSEMTGRPAVQLLKLATSRSAELLALSDRGRIAPGLRADLLVVAGDPLADIRDLKDVRHVVAAGVLVL